MKICFRNKALLSSSAPVILLARTGSVAQVRKFRNRFDAKELADIYFIEPKAVKSVLEAIDAHPDWDDERVAENVDFE